MFKSATRGIEIKNRKFSTIKMALLFYGTGFFLFLGAGATQPYLIPYLKNSLGYPLLASTFVLAVVYIIIIPARFFSLRLQRSIGLKLCIIIGATGYVLYPLIFAYSRNYFILLATSAMWGVAAGVFWTAASSLLLDLSQKKNYGIMSGVLYAGVGSGLALGVLLLGFILNRWGVRWMFLIAGISGIPALFTSSLLPYTQPLKAKVSLSFLKSFIFERGGLLVSLFLFIGSFGYGIIYSTMGTLIADSLGISWINKITVFYYFMSVLLSLFGGKLSDTFGRPKIFATSFALGAIATLTLTYFRSLPAFIISSALLGFQVSVVSVNTTAWAGDLGTSSERPLIIATIFAWNGLGVATSLLLGSYIVGNISGSYQTAFKVFTAISVIASLASLTLKRA